MFTDIITDASFEGVILDLHNKAHTKSCVLLKFML